MQARGWFNCSSDSYFWLVRAKRLSLNEILNYEPEDYYKPGFVPFASEADGSDWAWWPSAHFETVVSCPHDCSVGEYDAPTFVSFIYRRLLDYAGAVRLGEEQEVRKYLCDWSSRLSEYLPGAWEDTLTTLASVELIRWSYNGRDAGLGLLTYEQKEAIIQRDLVFPLLNREFEWMYP